MSIKLSKLEHFVSLLGKNGFSKKKKSSSSVHSLSQVLSRQLLYFTMQKYFIQALLFSKNIKKMCWNKRLGAGSLRL
jgi:hypothetical protein